MELWVQFFAMTMNCGLLDSEWQQMELSLSLVP